MEVLTFLRPESGAAPQESGEKPPSGGSRPRSPRKGRRAAAKRGHSLEASAAFSVGAPLTMQQLSGRARQGARHGRGERPLSVFGRKASPFGSAAAPSDSVPESAMSPAFSCFGGLALGGRDSASLGGGARPIFGALAPAVLALCAALCMAAPALQGRFGYHYMEERIAFGADGAARAAMNSLLNAGGNFFEARDASLAAAAFDIAEPVTYSAYTVRGGDTVSGIALRFGLDNISTILSVNGIENARRIRAGQELRIPSMDGVLHKAQAGDSLISIAARFGVPLEAILDANDLDNSAIAAGQELFVPGARLSTYDLRKAMGELFIYPISGRLTSRYGTRADPFTGVKSFHTGIDLAAPTGTPVKASTDGRVAAAGSQNVYGNYVIVTHAGGYQTLYAHMSSISVRRGQYLAQGDEVGKVGSTGYSTGPHLHFSVYKNGKTIDPFSVLD